MTERSDYTVAGWLAIVAAILTLPMLLLGIGVDILARTAPGAVPLVFLVYSSTVVCHTGFSVFAFLRFRSMLNTRHHFHDVDALVTALVVGAIGLGLLIIPAKGIGVMTTPEPAVIFAFVGVMLFCAIIMSVLSVVFAVRLLRLSCDLNGLLKPYVWVTIAAAACFAMFITAPLGLILDASANVLLGLILLKPEEASIPEFV